MPVASHWPSVSEPHLPVRVLRDTMDCRVAHFVPSSQWQGRGIHSVEILRSAQKSLAKIQGEDRERVIGAIRMLGKVPKPKGVRKLSGRLGGYGLGIIV